jgi:hypothetical protein
MANQEQALLIDAVLGSTTSEDGRHALIKMTTSGSEVAFAFPHDKLVDLITAAATASKACESIIQQDPNLRQLLPVEWWEFGVNPDKSFAFLSFRLPGGSQLAFQVPIQWIPKMRETFEVMEGREPMAPPRGTSKQ